MTLNKMAREGWAIVMKLSLKNVRIDSIGNSSGTFISKQNIIQHRNSSQKVNEVFGKVDGDHNFFIEDYFLMEDKDAIEQVKAGRKKGDLR